MSSAFIDRLINNKLTDDDQTFVQVALAKRKKPKAHELLKYPEFTPNYLHQADLLFLPHDKGYKYVVVVVDSGSKMIGLEPIKNKTPSTVVVAMKKIYARGPLKTPTRLNTDNGTEFKGAFKTYMSQLKINHQMGLPDRHATTKHVEVINGVISKVIFNLQYREEAKSNWTKQNTEFVSILKDIEKLYNAKIQKRLKKRPIKITPGEYKEPRKGDSVIIPIGTKVYKYLDRPQDPVGNKKLGSNFRATDLRLEKEPRFITDYILLPDQTTVAYTLSGYDRTRIFPKHSFTLASRVKKHS